MDRRQALEAMGLLALSPVAPAALSGCGSPPGPITKMPSWVDLSHPETEAELVALVREARSRGAQVRVRGSMHSHGPAIFTDEDSGNVNVHLDRYNRIVCWDDEKRQVTVQAGIHLGRDPLDETTSWENSLNVQLQRRGLALPSLGGITHQSVGGFLSTGSAGGSVQYDVGSAVVALRVVCGDGQVREFRRDPSDPHDVDENPFYAAGVAMGLFGIISTVTFQCVPSYNVIGNVVTRSTSSSEAPADVYGSGPRGLRHWLETTEYSRVMIWPQRGISKAEFWSAERRVPTHRFRPNPYVPLSRPLQKVASAIYETIDQRPPPYEPSNYEHMLLAIRTFITDDEKRFWDYWYRGLPQDNGMSDVWMPAEFTELFVDIEHTERVMTTLRDYWKGDDRMNRTGPFTTEVYAGKASEFWMSPSFRKNTFRVDFLWFKSGKTNPGEVFYPQYWELLRDFEFRFHWGKHLSSPDSSTGVAYRRARLGEVKWNRWMALRDEMDPDQLFVNEYWRAHLGIARR